MIAFRMLPAVGVLVVALGASAADAITPGEPIDYERLAFYPERWKEQGVDFDMTPWRGEKVVFLTKESGFDPGVMGGLLAKLDEGWDHYAALTGRSPAASRQVGGLPPIAAVPAARLTCGYGCGFVGATGIELSAFYSNDYKQIAADPNAIPDYYFYEMGRNYYTFGRKHSSFITGFAVFMRYVCLDKLGLKSAQPLRSTIESAEAVYARSGLEFLPTFTNHAGLREKVNRLKDADGRTIGPSDQPVMYASAMLRLRRDYGGDTWVARFFRQLATCPDVRVTDEATALRQCLNWLAAASCAAGEDLSPVFYEEWRMPLTTAQRRVMDEVDWEREPKASEVVERLDAAG